MRALIWTLITLNLALAAWSWHYGEEAGRQKAVPLPEVAVVEQESEAVEVVADAEVPTRPVAVEPVKPAPQPVVAPAPVAAPPAAPAPAPKPPKPEVVAVAPTAEVLPDATATQEGCVVYGPFERAAPAAELVSRLEAAGLVANFEQETKRVHRGRWVLFPVADQAAAQALMAKFEAAGLKDFALVRKSPMGMAVSGGLYAGERSLTARLKSLSIVDDQPEVTDLYKENSVYQVRVPSKQGDPEKYGKYVPC